jgi:hypothetical protein
MFGQIRRPGLNARSNVLQILPSHSPIVAHPILLLPPSRVSEHSAVPTSYGVHSCALFMVRFSIYVQNWSSMTDKTAIGCKIKWSTLVGTDNKAECSDSFGHN